MAQSKWHWSNWAKGLIAAAVSSIGNVGSLLVVDPAHFNFHDNALLIGKMIAINAIIGILLYLKQSPIPKEDGDDAAAKP